MENERKFDDGVLMVVTASVYGHRIQALIDSGATRCCVPSLAVISLGLKIVKDYTFVELGDDRKSSPKAYLTMSQ